MPAGEPGCLSWTAEKLREYLADGRNGFGGARCWSCKATVNILTPSIGFFCECGEYNTLGDDTWFSHETPTYGPTAAEIKAACLLVKETRNR